MAPTRTHPLCAPPISITLHKPLHFISPHSNASALSRQYYIAGANLGGGGGGGGGGETPPNRCFFFGGGILGGGGGGGGE